MNIGPAEILVILVFALLIEGPERLPKIGSAIGKAIYRFNSVRSEVSKALETDGIDLQGAGRGAEHAGQGSKGAMQGARQAPPNPFIALGDADETDEAPKAPATGAGESDSAKAAMPQVGENASQDDDPEGGRGASN